MPVAVRLRLSLEPSRPPRAQKSCTGRNGGAGHFALARAGWFPGSGPRERAVPDRGHTGIQFPRASTSGCPRTHKGFAHAERCGSLRARARACGSGGERAGIWAQKSVAFDGAHARANEPLPRHPYKAVRPPRGGYPLYSREAGGLRDVRSQKIKKSGKQKRFRGD